MSLNLINDIQEKNLIIGNTSQLSYFFPENYDRISSRNINVNEIINKKYDNIYILFSEQRTFLNETEQFFIDINVKLTLYIINQLKNHCGRIIVYSTSELWNNYDREITATDKFDYNYSPYIKSKEILCNTINENRDNYRNVIIIYPFNFNSPFRKSGFLFSKIFNSIINKEKTIIGDVDFYRDIVHPSIIVKNSILTKDDIVIGSGELINIKKFIIDLYNVSNLKINDYLSFNSDNNLKNTRKNYYSKIKYSNYQELLQLTHYDTTKNIIS